MTKIFCKLFFFLSFTIFSADLFAQPNWMAENGALLGKKQLNQIVLPGAHDAGTYAIKEAKSSNVRLGGGEGLNSPDNKPLKQLLSFGSTFSNWAKTQERTTLEMLNDGIRYFDIRICVDSKGVFMTCHGMYGASLESILDDVKTFTEKNPKEIVMLGFNHFWERQYQIEQRKKQGEIEGLTKNKWTELITFVKTKLSGKLLSSEEFSPRSKLEDVWKLKNNNQVIALFDSSDVPNDELIWKQLEVNTWVEDWYQDDFKAKTLKVLENAQNNLYADKFYAIRSSVTPDEGGKLIRMGFISNVYPKSVSELADMTNPVALGWIKNEWAGKYPINLVWSDFYNRTDLIKLAKHLNGIKVDFANTKIGIDTNWSKWKKSNETNNKKDTPPKIF